MRTIVRATFVAVLTIAALSGFVAPRARAMDAPNVTTMKSLYDAFGKGDVQKIIDTMDPGVMWESYGDSKICSCLGPHKGKDGVGAFFKSVGDTWDFSEFKPMNFTADGDKVIVEGHYTMKAKATGKEMSSHFLHVITFKDGKVTDFHEFLDTAAMAMALQK